jgi:ketosteroid isomerase-like protein
MLRHLPLIYALALAAPCPALAQQSTPPPAADSRADAAEAVATITRFTDSVNAGDQQAAIAHFTADASITEDVPPYRWHGPEAGAQWLLAMWENGQRAGLANIAMTLGAPTRVEVSGDHAYLVVPGALTFEMGGQPRRDDGALTFALQKSEGVWLIGSLAWAGGPRVPSSGDAPSAERARIEAVEALWADALLRKDQAALDRLMAPEFQLEGAGFDEVTLRAEWLANLQRMDVRSYSARVTDVQINGDRAVATVVGEWSIARGDQTLQDRFELLDTWERRDGEWRVTKRYRTNPPPARTGQ